MDGWALFVAVVGLVVSCAGLVLSFVAARAATISIRRPKLEMESMMIDPLQAAPFWGEIRRQQERYGGPPPDGILIVTVRNTGKVPALRVSGSLHILDPIIEPLNYPGYANVRIQIAAHAGVYVVHIPPADEHRAPPEPTHDRLSYWIPVKVHYPRPEDGEDDVGFWESLSGKKIRIAYRLVAENSDPIDGEWVAVRVFDDDTVDDAGPVPDADRMVPAPLAAGLDGGLLKRLRRVFGR